MMFVFEQAAPENRSDPQQGPGVVSEAYLKEVGVQLHAPHPQIHLVCQAQVLVIRAQQCIVGLQTNAGVSCSWGDLPEDPVEC